MSSSHKLDQLLDEIAATEASYGDMLMGGGALDEDTVITITWPGKPDRPQEQPEVA